MQTIEYTLAGLEVGAPQVHANLAVYPLSSAVAPAASYLLLDEALAKQLARITEVSASTSVPELAFEDGSAEKIPLDNGDELIGARQNRVVNITIVVGAGRKLVIPGSRVEQERQSEVWEGVGRKSDVLKCCPDTMSTSDLSRSRPPD